MDHEDTEKSHVETVPVVVITGFVGRAQKVSATQEINRLTDLGLAESKLCIDQALARIPSTIQMDDLESAEELRSTLDALGWEVRVDRQVPSKKQDWFSKSTKQFKNPLKA